jgi:hypothetical protein
MCYKYILNILLFLVILFTIAYVFIVDDLNEKNNSRNFLSVKTPLPLNMEITSHNYIINNNVAQYSVYTVKIQENYLIEAFIFLNYKHLSDHAKLDNYLCLLKCLNHEIIELKPIESPTVYFGSNRKFIFKFNKTNFKSYNDTGYFNVDNILIAIIRIDDYNRTISENEFNERLNLTNSTIKFDRIVLPYSLINYQKPLVIQPIEPRLKTVSSCIPYTYNVPSGIYDWIDLHLTNGISEIMFYDSTPNLELTQKINDKYQDDKRIIVMPYRIN